MTLKMKNKIIKQKWQKNKMRLKILISKNIGK